MRLVAAHAAGAALPVFGVFAGGGLIFMAFGNAGCRDRLLFFVRLVAEVARDRGHRTLVRYAGMALCAAGPVELGELLFRECVALQARDVCRIKPVNGFPFVTTHTGFAARREVMLCAVVTLLARNLLDAGMPGVPICLGGTDGSLRYLVGMAAGTLFPRAYAAMCHADRIPAGHDIRDEPYVLLDIAQLVALLAECVAVLALEPVAVGTFYVMAGFAEVGIVLGIAVVVESVKKKTHDDNCQNQALDAVGKGHRTAG